MSQYKPYTSLKGVFFAFILCISVGQTALAGIAPTPCDPAYYDSLRSRAWLEAQREITQNQNLIFKPDSVMEYTCFDQFMNILAYEAQNMFSETTRWGTILNSDSMDIALRQLVGTALTSYINSNFNHTTNTGGNPPYPNFLNGRSTRNHVPGTISGAPASSYLCEHMREVWRESKCLDFAADPNTDGFFTFENYRNNEKRTRPTACNNPNIGNTWQTEINLATVNANTPWVEDNVVTFFNLLDPGACSGALEIETGITVQRSKANPTTYREKACIPAGCRYVPTGMNAGNCQN